MYLLIENKTTKAINMSLREQILIGNKISGRRLSKILRAQIKEDVAKLKEQFGEDIKLVAILVGDDPASQLYVSMKHKACEKAGIASETYHLPKETSEEELLKLIDKLNKDPTVHGILVQLPLPPQINEHHVLYAINPDKDVDGFHPTNTYKLYLGTGHLMPATPKGVVKILDALGVELRGKNVAVINRSLIVGRPLALMLMHRDATVTICHSKTRNLKDITLRSDIVISAIGRRKSKEDPYYITADMVNPGTILIDVATPNGDADFKALTEKGVLTTPVPGGVGPMTITMLLENLVIAYKIQKGLIKEEE